MPLFSRNIDSKGRIIRAIGAAALLIGAIFVWPHSRAAGIGMGLSAIFVGFEAARGWCALRACGIKTKF